jgi:hypothetical protein
MANKVKSLKLQIPEYLTIEKYEKMNSYKGQNKFGRLVHTVSVLTKEPFDEVRHWDLDSLTKVSNLYASIADHNNFFYPLVMWKGKLYGYSSITKASLGEYIDLENNCKELEGNMHKVAAILYRPVVKHRFKDLSYVNKQGIDVVNNKTEDTFKMYTIEKYDSDKRADVEEEFKEFPVHLFLGAISFFLSTGSLYLNDIAFSRKRISITRQLKNKIQITESLLANTGDGSVQFTHSLKPMYFRSQETRV